MFDSAKHWSLPWLVAGALFLAVGQGHWPSGLLIVVGMCCVVHFFRGAHPLLALPLFVIAHTLVWEAAYRGMVPLPWGARLGVEVGTSALLGACFLLDRWLARRCGAFWATLMLPCGLVGYDLTAARLSPGGTWGSIAYTFVDEPVIAQVAGLVGWVGITFMVGWIAAALNRAAVRGSAGQSWRGGVACVAGVSLALLLYGAVRLRPAEGAVAATRVACIVAPSTYSPERVNEVWAYTRGVQASPESNQAGIDRIEASLQEHIALAERAAERGAGLLLWPEVSGSVSEHEEGRWIAEAGRLAKTYRAHVGLGLMVFRPHTQRPSINKYLLIGPDGEVLSDFIKATRPPGVGHIVGDGVLPVLDLPFGRTTTAICFDLDFPQLIGQAGRMHADVLLAPSNDWQEAARTHARMARMRAIEQGVTLVRPTRDGVSLVSDACGRVVASLWLDDGETGTLICDLPAGRRGTLYGRTGDAFGWLCLAAVVALCLAGWRCSRQGKTVAVEPS